MPTISFVRRWVAQADSFVDFLNQNRGLQPADLRPVLDLEWGIATKNGPDRWQLHTPDQISARRLVRRWLEVCH
jgi:hypothetical protein